MTVSNQMRPELSLTIQNGIIHFLIASPQARSVRIPHPLLPPPADLISKGFTSCCLPCLTFGKTQARVQDPTLQNYSSINSEVGTPSSYQWFTNLSSPAVRHFHCSRYGILPMDHSNDSAE
jgi:hypothetical protein